MAIAPKAASGNRVRIVDDAGSHDQPAYPAHPQGGLSPDKCSDPASDSNITLGWRLWMPFWTGGA
jgi:hypothetical protein